ncbi:MAG: PadR family transcriptional regulator [Candidatus Eremiobacteraeota bacterium]|nr:PadR family transcriptional regulator [Candidatus Eremiobacteraeota bacterium]
MLLQLLSDESRHGYDLIREFRRKGWPGGPGSIYPLLAALEEDGLIVGRDEGERRTYAVTDKGREHLKEHSNGFGNVFENDDEEDEPGNQTRSDLRDAAGRLMQAVTQLGPSSKSETIERVRELLDRTRKEIYTLLAQE